MPRLDTHFTKKCPKRLRNPFGVGSGPPGSNRAKIIRLFRVGFGFVVIKTVSLDGSLIINPVPAYADLVEGGVTIGKYNAELISNRDYGQWLDDIRAIKDACPQGFLVGSIMESTEERIRQITREVIAAGVDAIEYNGSCGHGMNERGMGTAVGEDDEAVFTVCRFVCEEAGDVPVLFKITPNTPSALGQAKAAHKAGCAGVTATNTVRSLPDVNPRTRVPMPAIAGEWSTTGGLSGPAMRWIVNARIWEVANWAAQECPDFVISGLGGAKTWDHALSFFGYGASHAQFCTVLMDEQPEPVLERLQAGALAWMGENGYDSFDEVPGFAVSHVVKHSVAVGHSQAYRAGSVSRRAAAAPQAPEGGDDIVAESAALTARNDN